MASSAINLNSLPPSLSKRLISAGRVPTFPTKWDTCIFIVMLTNHLIKHAKSYPGGSLCKFNNYKILINWLMQWLDMEWFKIATGHKTLLLAFRIWIGMKMAVEDQFTILPEDCANIKLREVTIGIAIWKVALNLMHEFKWIFHCLLNFTGICHLEINHPENT